ncbi:MAG: hypothetical protein HWE10_03245 [Gammaproteobacteria bacterium]|nr:hypothetical protein [Gammaproteobacteria bacterium]
MSKTKEWFDPSKSFFDLPIVWWTVGIIGGVFVVIAVSIIYHGNYSFDGSAAGFNLFVKDFAFPLGVLSLLIPIIAVFAAQHRSNISIKQINEAVRANNFSIYCKHLELFEIYINDSEYKNIVEHIRTFHLALFKNIKNGSDIIDDDTQTQLYNGFIQIYENLIMLQSLQCGVTSFKIYSKELRTAIQGTNQLLLVLFKQLGIDSKVFNLHEHVSLESTAIEHYSIAKWCCKVQLFIQLLNHAIKFCSSSNKLFYVLRDLEKIKYGYDAKEQLITFNIVKTDSSELNVTHDLRQMRFIYPKIDNLQGNSEKCNSAIKSQGGVT